MRNPFKRIFAIQRDELPTALLMAGYFFLVITSFWILKPLKKALFIGYLQNHSGLDLYGWVLDGPEAEQLAKVLNMFVAALAVAAFSVLSKRFVRQQLTMIFSLFVTTQPVPRGQV